MLTPPPPLPLLPPLPNGPADPARARPTCSAMTVLSPSHVHCTAKSARPSTRAVKRCAPPVPPKPAHTAFLRLTLKHLREAGVGAVPVPAARLPARVDAVVRRPGAKRLQPRAGGVHVGQEGGVIAVEAGHEGFVHLCHAVGSEGEGNRRGQQGHQLGLVGRVVQQLRLQRGGRTHGQAAACDRGRHGACNRHRGGGGCDQ
jgi:hypothetical protein